MHEIVQLRRFLSTFRKKIPSPSSKRRRRTKGHFKGRSQFHLSNEFFPCSSDLMEAWIQKSFVSEPWSRCTLRMRQLNHISYTWICGRYISIAESVLLIFTASILFACCCYVCLNILSQIQISFAYTGHISKQLQVGSKMHFKLWRMSELKKWWIRIGDLL